MSVRPLLVLHVTQRTGPPERELFDCFKRLLSRFDGFRNLPLCYFFPQGSLIPIIPYDLIHNTSKDLHEPHLSSAPLAPAQR